MTKAKLICDEGVGLVCFGCTCGAGGAGAD